MQNLDISSIPELVAKQQLPLSTVFSLFLNNIAYRTFFQHPQDNSMISVMHKLCFNPTLINFGFHYILLGCKVELKQITLKPNTPYVLDLSDTIKGGKLLYINYTAQNGGLYPIEMHGNCPMGHEYSIRKKLYPITMPHAIPKETPVSIMYAYSTKEQNADIILHELIKAFENIVKPDHAVSIMQLQIACESALRRFIGRYTEEFSTFYKELEKLPSYLSQDNLPPIPDFILDSVHKLRKIRNKLMHDGYLNDVSENDMKDFAIHAFLFCKYFEVMDIEKILSNHTN